MLDMEVDRLVALENHVVVRCGDGQALIVFWQDDDSMSLKEVDFIECESMMADSDFFTMRALAET